MTAELVVLNKGAAAIAADSAATVRLGRSKKIFSSAQKIFRISKNHPVGIMVYGNSEMLGVPWEVLIALYKRHVADKKYKNFSSYLSSFIKLIKEDKNKCFPPEIQAQHVERTAGGYFSTIIISTIDEEAEKILARKKSITPHEYKKIISDVIKREFLQWEKAKYSTGLTIKEFDRIKKKYEKIFARLIKIIFKKYPLTSSLKDMLMYVGAAVLVKDVIGITNPSKTGLVIVGYGENDIFPSIESVIIEGVAGNSLKYKLSKNAKISQNLEALVMPFAQSDMVETFMEGVDPEYQSVIFGSLNRVVDGLFDIFADKVKSLFKSLTPKQLSDIEQKFKAASMKAVRNFNKETKEYRNKSNVEPIIDVIRVLSPKELSNLADSLVDLTSLKRKVSMNQEETVGGPTDVAIITKNDGFKWVKKKDGY